MPQIFLNLNKIQNGQIAAFIDINMHYTRKRGR